MHKRIARQPWGPIICDSISPRGCGIWSLNPRCWERKSKGEDLWFSQFCLLSWSPCLLLPLFHKLIWMVTFMSAILLGLDIGLVVAVTFAFFIITVQSHRYFVWGDRRWAMSRWGNCDLKANAFPYRTKILLLGQIPNTNIYRSFQDYREVRIQMSPTPLPKGWDGPGLLLSISTKKKQKKTKLFCSSLLHCRYAFTFTKWCSQLRIILNVLQREEGQEKERCEEIRGEKKKAGGENQREEFVSSWCL